MSDYIPDPRLDPRSSLNDPRNVHNAQMVYGEPTERGTGTYGIVAALVIGVLVVGFLFFGGPPRDRAEMARAPDASPTVTMERPATPATPTPATPAPLPNEPVRQ